MEVTVDAKKFRANGLGEERDIPMNESVELGIRGESGEWLHREFHGIRDGGNGLTLQLKKKPVAAVVNPRLLLLDRNLKDNEREL